MLPVGAIVDSIGNSLKISLSLYAEEMKSFDYKAHLHLVKPTLYFLSTAALATSAVMYIVDKQKEPEVEKVVYDLKPSVVGVSGSSLPSSNGTKLDNLSGFQRKEYWCLKVLGWNEIRNGSEYAIKAVYTVVENRKNSGAYPSTYCEIMKQHKQFSFWNQGKYNIKEIEPNPENDKDREALRIIEKVSLKLVTGNFNPVLPSNVLWYAAPYVKVKKGANHWTNKYKVVTEAGGHLFYLKKV